MLIGDVAVAVGDLVDEIGRVQIAAVDAGRLRRDERDGRDVAVLAEGVAREVELGHVLRRGEDAGGLAAEVDAGLLHQAEGLHIVIVFLRPDLQTVGDEGWVAGVGDRLDEGLLAVAVVVRAADRRAHDVDGAGAVDCRALVDDALLERGGQRQDLERRTGLIGIVERLVAPLAQLHLAERGGAVLDGGAQTRVLHGRRVVEVIVRIGCHGEDAAGLGVHDDAGGAVFRVELVEHLLDAFFKVVLHGGVEREDEVAAVLGGVVLLVLIEQVVARVVARGDDETGLALELVLILRFQPVKTGVVRADEADHLRGERPVWVIALGVGAEVDALDAVFVDEASHFVGNVLVDAELEHLILRVGALHLLEDAVLADAENLAEPLRDQLARPGDGLFSVAERLVDGIRVEKDRLCRGRDGEDVAARVIDRPARGSDDGAAYLLVDGLFLQLIVAADLQLIELEEKDDKEQHPHHKHQDEAAALNHPVGAPDLFAFSVTLRHWFSSLCQARSKKSPSYSLHHFYIGLSHYMAGLSGNIPPPPAAIRPRCPRFC